MMKKYAISLLSLLIGLPGMLLYAQHTDRDVITIRKTTDFTITGDGVAENWKKADWINIPQRTVKGISYPTKAKVLYSPGGIYFLFNCEDKQLTATMNADFLDLWNEDVVEIFLWPDEKTPQYLEYELSPLNYELPILIHNANGVLNSWIPFHYEGERKTQHATAIRGGEKKSHATIGGWDAEFFIPFKLMEPLTTAPRPGTLWRGNLYRIDYDKGETLFMWQLTNGNYHEYQKFGTLIFE